MMMQRYIERRAEVNKVTDLDWLLLYDIKYMSSSSSINGEIAFISQSWNRVDWGFLISCSHVISFQLYEIVRIILFRLFKV